MRLFEKLIIASLCCLGAASANAAVATGSFQVRVTIADTCIVDSSPPLDFGSPGVLAANIDQTTIIGVRCSNSTAYNIGLNQGVNGSSVTTRQMKFGTETINYSLFSDAGRTTNWGETIPTDTVQDVGNGGVQNHTVFGRIPGPQTTPSAGLYTDTITITITY